MIVEEIILLLLLPKIEFSHIGEFVTRVSLMDTIYTLQEDLAF
jgi:hypothetical protein